MALTQPVMITVTCRSQDWLLSVPRTRLSTYGDQALPVAAVRIWKPSAPYHICSITSHLLLSPEDILLWSLLLVITVVMPAKWHSFMDTLIALTYLHLYLPL